MKLPTASEIRSIAANGFSQAKTTISGLISQFTRKAAPISKNQVTIGLDIGRAYINLVQIQKTETEIILEKCVHQQILSNIPLSAQLKNLFQEAGITQKRVRVSLKGQGVILRFISFPKMTHEEFESSIQYEAEKYLPFAMAEVIFDFYIADNVKVAGDPGRMMEVILVAARKQEIFKLVKTLQDAELAPESIDVDAVAFTNAFNVAEKDSKEKVFALIDFGMKDVNLNIMDHGVLRFSRDITFGGYDITQFLKRKLQVDDQTALSIQSGKNASKPEYKSALQESLATLIQEIKLSLNYFYSQHQEMDPLSAIYMSGGLAQMKLLQETLSHDIKLPVLEWNPVGSLKIAPEINKEELDKLKLYLPVCVGLAVK